MRQLFLAITLITTAVFASDNYEIAAEEAMYSHEDFEFNDYSNNNTATNSFGGFQESEKSQDTHDITSSGSESGSTTMASTLPDENDNVEEISARDLAARNHASVAAVESFQKTESTNQVKIKLRRSK